MGLSISPNVILVATIDELTTQLQFIDEQIGKKDRTQSIDLAEEIVLLSDAKMITGELLARCELEHENMKSLYDMQYGIAIKEERIKWKNENPDLKFPASTYFDRLALGPVYSLKCNLNKKKKLLSSYRKLHDNYEVKINALKKLQERVVNVGW